LLQFSDCPFAEILRLEFDMQLYLLVFKFEAQLGWVSPALTATQTSDEGSENLDLESCKNPRRSQPTSKNDHSI
jgi:hypothetical protein